MKKFDVAVAGCGPSGLAAAYLLSSAGMNVALIDRSAFPRDKLCGGLLSSRARTIFEGIFHGAWEPAIEYETRGARFFGKGGLLNSVEESHSFYLTSRRVFDSYLFELTEQKGPKIFQGIPIASVDQENSRVLLKNGTAIEADYIIGADGVTSRVRDSLFPHSFDKKKYALCFQADLPKSEIPEPPKLPQIYFGFVRWGYGWVFHKKESLSIGIGGSLHKNRDLKQQFTRFHKYVTGRTPHGLRGHYIPFGNFMKTPGRKSILLAGDAAGLVDPITGEGIAYAMLSGKFAAESILQAARLGAPDMAYGFYKARYDDIVSSLFPAKLMRYFMFQGFAEDMFIRSLPHAGGVLENYMSVIAGKMSYYAFGFKAIGQTMKSLFQRGRKS